ncbi:anti-sigma factor [Trinickia sp. LjRoot230]|uniref:anti-sigma factor family protein n=1 Tax=Trinickia sp. LjRoot230 TaxID=3342288 RepID=UPI003ECC3FFF
MTVDDVMLMEYVDGTADPDVSALVERAAAQSSEVAERLAAMKASALPFGDLFDRQVVPAIPERLAARVTTMTLQPARRRIPTPWLAAAFFAGVLSTGFAFKFFSLIGDDSQPAFSRVAALVSPSEGMPRWARAVVDYQDLYSRDTVAGLTENREATARVVNDIRRVDGMSIRVPDLRNAGLTFKRVQRLNYKGHPIVQIVYLADRGAPVALCAIVDAGPDASLHAQQVGDMKTIVWRKANIGYVLVSKDAPVDLPGIGARIAKGEASTLYGSAFEHNLTHSVIALG